MSEIGFEKQQKKYRIKELILEPDNPNSGSRKFTVGTNGVEAIQVDTPGLYVIWFEKGVVWNVVSPAWTAIIKKEEVVEPLIIVPELVPPTDAGNAA